MDRTESRSSTGRPGRAPAATTHPAQSSGGRPTAAQPAELPSPSTSGIPRRRDSMAPKPKMDAKELRKMFAKKREEERKARRREKQQRQIELEKRQRKIDRKGMENVKPEDD